MNIRIRMLNCSIESTCAGQFQYIGVYMAIHDSVYSDTKIQIHRPDSIEAGIIPHVISPIGQADWICLDSIWPT